VKGPAIEVKDLSLQLAGNQILAPMSFRIAAGSLHAIVGPNGAGKTSLLRCLLGLMPHQGEIRLHWAGHESIGYVPQQLHMERTLPLTVADFMSLIAQDSPAFVSRPGNTTAIISEALARVGMNDKADLMLGSLSGGERQRVLFAQALMPLPALLILDEPMTSLDETGSQIFEQLILDINASGSTVLWVNHDLGQAYRLCDSVTVINQGLLAHGPMADTLSTAMLQGDFTGHARQEQS
jgi:zinc transport system ATP-binding protein